MELVSQSVSQLIRTVGVLFLDRNGEGLPLEHKTEALVLRVLFSCSSSSMNGLQYRKVLPYEIIPDSLTAGGLLSGQRNDPTPD